MKSVDTAAIFAPVQDSLPLVEEQLRLSANTDYPLLTDLLQHVLSRGGKRLRPAINLLAGRLFVDDLTRHILLATAVELLHTATLVHDDLIDNSATRRGIPTLNSLWSSRAAVLAGDYLFAKSADLVASTENVRVMGNVARTLMIICGGELRQLFGANDWKVDRQEYYDRIFRKTASLFVMAAETGAILAGAEDRQVAALSAYGYKLGIGFQIVDDILDFTSDEVQLGKPVGHDLREGTLTLPALLLLEAYPEDNPIRRMLSDGDREAEATRAIEMIRNSTVIEDSYRIAGEFCQAAREALRELPDDDRRMALTALTEYVVERRS
jgi:geranylgeranyl pyrophosphate synthase